MNQFLSGPSRRRSIFPYVRTAAPYYDGSEKNAKFYVQKRKPLCWAIAPADSCSMFLRRFGTLPSNENLSANILVDSLDPRNRQTTECKPYEASLAFEFIKTDGIPTQTDSPFTCTKYVHDTRNKDGFRWKIPTWVDVPIDDSHMTIQQTNSGSMVVDMVCGKSFDSLKKNVVYTGPSHDEEGEYPYRHSVVVCGYSTLNRGEQVCWRIKNSQGKSWGDGGYANVIFQSQLSEDDIPFIERAYAPCRFY